MKYWIVMIDFGGRLGMEATVNPEDTRADIVSKVRETIKEGSSKRLVHVKEIDGNYCEDVTDDFIRAAEFDTNVEFIGCALDSIQAARFDRGRDVRKHEVA
jgi:hypothetical protein